MPYRCYMFSSLYARRKTLARRAVSTAAGNTIPGAGPALGASRHAARFGGTYKGKEGERQTRTHINTHLHKHTHVRARTADINHILSDPLYPTSTPLARWLFLPPYLLILARSSSCSCRTSRLSNAAARRDHVSPARSSPRSLIGRKIRRRRGLP